MPKTAALVVLLAVVGGSLAEDYCRICKEHTMCQYKQDPGPMCNPILKSGVSDRDRQEILATHNKYRSQVAQGRESGQPSASNMRKLYWDKELARIAQHWVNQCMYRHDDCHNVRRFSVGQNLALIGSSEDNQPVMWKSAIAIWYGEVEFFDSDDIEAYVYDKPTAHYTQLVWADTHFVGCGFSKYPNGSDYLSFYACNYGPTGNVATKNVYEEGDVCTQCPKGTTLCEGGLCV